MIHSRITQWLVPLLAFIPLTATATDFYVAPAGSSSGAGSISSPWDLRTAFNQPAAVKPGDTIWLRGGTYTGPFTSSLRGSSTAPIIVRQYPGERATLTGNASAPEMLAVNGAWTWYWGFEVICPDVNRYANRGSGVGAYGPNTRFINLVVHDNGNGFGFWQPATDSTIYGSIIYNNGYEQGDRGHGHSIYTQNQTGTKHILDNIFFQSFSEGIQLYGSSAAGLNNYDIQGNIAFNHGIPSVTGGAKDNLLLGGDNVAQNLVLSNNYTYYPTWAPGRNDIGYASGCNNVTLTGNYFSQPEAINLNCTNVTMTGNTYNGRIVGFSQGQYSSNTYFNGNATGVKVFVRPNTYEQGRANVVVFNWDRVATVNVDMSSVLTVGQAYVVQDVQNFYGPPVASGTYRGGTIPIPTGLSLVAATIGVFPVPNTHTAQEFNAYVVLPLAGTVAPPVNQAPSVSAGSAQTITLPAVANLSGTVTDDGLPSNTLTTTWSKVSGPGSVTFGSASARQTTATFGGAGTYVLQLSATDSSLTTTSQVTITVNSATPGVPAGGSAGVVQFVKTDFTTQGNWKGVYGSQGSIIVGDTSVLPSGISVVPSGQNPYTWIDSTSDVRALSKRTTGRIAATWFSGSTFNIDLNTTDGTAHQLAVYCLDWDNGGPRKERIDVVDAGNNTVLDTRTVTSFQGGQYFVWNVTGHVIVKVTPTGGANAVISGLFWDAPGGAVIPPVVIPPVVIPPVVIPPVVIPPVTGTNAAQFVKLDTTTKGNWKGVYGNLGAQVVSDATTPATFAVVKQNNAFEYTWLPSTTDTRALSRVVQSGRIAATWFSATFNLDVTITDGNTHQLAMYCVDWDTAGPRSQRVDVVDAVTGAVLDTRTVSSFVGGQYLVWNVKGHVLVKVTTLQGANAVVSGLFWN